MVDIQKLHEALRNGVLKDPGPLPSMPVQSSQTPVAGSFLATLGLPSDYSRDTGKTVGALQEEPSWISKFFDTLSAPLYGVYDVADNYAKVADGGGFGDFLKDMGQTALGTVGRVASGIDDILIPGDIVPDAVQEWSEEKVPHRLGSDVLEDLGVENNIAKHGLGFIMDVGLDPLTYLGGAGLLKRGAKGVHELAEPVADAVPTTPNPALFQRPETPDLSAATNVSPLNLSPRSTTPGRVLEGISGATDEAGNLLPVAREALEREIVSDPAVQAFRNNAARKQGDYYPDATRANHVPLSEYKAAKAGKVAEGGGKKLHHETLRRMVADINAGVLPGPAMRAAESATGVLKDEAEAIYRNWEKGIKSKTTAKGHTELNPANQANLWNSIVSRVKQGMLNPEEAGLFTTKLMKDGTAYLNGSKAEQFAAAVPMLRAAEDAAIAAGNVPQYWNGTRVRLSDLLNEIGYDGYKEHGTALINAFKERDFSKIDNPLVQAKIGELTARSTVKDSWIVDTAKNYTDRALADLFDNVPAVQANAMVARLPDEIEAMVRAAGLTKKEAAAVRDVARGVIGLNRDPLDNVIYRFGQELQKSKIDGKLSPKVVSAMNHKIQDMMKITPTDVSVRAQTRNVMGEIMLRMTTWFKRGEMKKFADNTFIAGELRAKARAAGIGNLLRNYSQQELNNAMRVAQGIFPEAGRTAKELEASRFIRDYFEETIGSSRLRDYKDYEGTVAFRSATTMNDINKALKDLGSKFEFTNKPYKHPATGVKRNTSEDIDWTRSWEALDPSKLGYKNPAHLLYDIDLAMERVTNEYAMVDTFVNNFGARRTDRHFNPARHTTPLAHSRGGDYYFDKETVENFNRLLKDIHDGLWKPEKPLVKHYARGLSSWKRGVTIYMPSHHVRNMIGDIHMTWWAGHNDPRDFIRARKVLGANRARYNEVIQSGNIQEINKLIDPVADLWNSTNATDVILKQGKNQLTAGEIYKAAFDRGLLLRAQQLEDLFGDSVQEAMSGGAGMRNFLKRPLGGKAHDTASNLSEYRDHYVRLHHFIAATNKVMKKGKNKNLDFDKIFDDAAAEVRKWHPDGRDLTQFEQKIRLTIPFYSWTRKAIPLMVQSAVQAPAKITYAPKAVAALQGVAGIETENPILDPFPDDQLFPEWIRASGIGPIGAAHDEDNPWSSFWGRLGRNLVNPFGEFGYTVINPGNPFIDTAESHVGSGSIHDLLSGVMGMTTPAFQIPANLYANETGIGRPIMGDEPGAMGLGQYAAEQVPILAPLQNVLEVGRDQKPNIDNTFDAQALMNYLTAAGITGTSPYIKSAEFEVKG